MALVQGPVSADVHSMQFSFQENQKGNCCKDIFSYDKQKR